VKVTSSLELAYRGHLLAGRFSLHNGHEGTFRLQRYQRAILCAVDYDRSEKRCI